MKDRYLDTVKINFKLKKKMITKFAPDGIVIPVDERFDSYHYFRTVIMTIINNPNSTVGELLKTISNTEFSEETKLYLMFRATLSINP